MVFKKIDNFYIEISEKSWNLKVQSDQAWYDSKPNENYLIGYKENVYKDAGEYIAITQNNGAIEIKGDKIGAIPIYRFHKDNVNFITSALTYGLFINNCKINVDNNYLNNYFSLGYTYLDEKTHFQNISLWQEPLQVIKINGNSIKRIFDSKKKYFSKIQTHPTKNLLDAIKSKLNSIEKNKSILLLSGGNDSLVCALGIKALGYSIDTATFGTKKSHDLVTARKRSEKIFPNSIHHEHIIEKNLLDENDINSHTINQNGFGTLSNINYSIFLKKLAQLGYKNIIFGDYFEIMRKRLDDEKLVNNYLTPEIVIEQFFSSRKDFYDIKKTLSRKLEQYYLKDCYEKFYLFDRTIKGCSWKNNLCRSLSLTKVTLAFNDLFISSAITKFKIDGAFNDEVLKNLSDISEISINESTDLDKGLKHQPLNPVDIIYQNKEFFISLFKENDSLEISNNFKLKKICDFIEKETLKNNDHWFILRLANLLNILKICSNNSMK